MEKCKFCQEELAEDSTICPHCGRDNADTEEKEAASETVKEEVEVSEEKTELVEAAAEKTEEASEQAEEKQEEAESAEPAAEEKQEAAESAEPAPAQEKQEDKKPEEKKKATPGQMALGIAVVIALAAILVALIISALGQKKDEIPPDQPLNTTSTQFEEFSEPAPAPVETAAATVPADGNPEDATCKGTYTAEAEQLKAASQEVVARAGEYELTNSELQIYYWKGIQAFLESNPYAAYMVDMSTPLDVQLCPLAENTTWQQFFLTNALASWQNYQSMAAAAEKNQVPEDPEVQKFISTLAEQIEQDAKDNGFADGAEMLAANVGPGSSVQDYVKFMQVYQRGYGYYMYFLTQSEPDDAALEKYYQEHEDVLEEGGISKDAKSVNVRHILVSPKDPEADDSWKEAEKKANDLLKQFTDGDKREETFAALAAEHTEDPGSKQTGGLYEGVLPGQMVPEFDQWCFDDTRKIGDTGVVKTDFGYHIMFYSGDQLTWKDQVANLYLSEKSDELLQEHQEAYPLTVEYSKILLGVPAAKEQ